MVAFTPTTTGLHDFGSRKKSAGAGTGESVAVQRREPRSINDESGPVIGGLVSRVYEHAAFFAAVEENAMGH
jgi:hypothetical protein